MHIDLATHGGLQHGAGRQVVLDESEAEGSDGAQHLVDPVKFHDDIHVFMISGLFTEERRRRRVEPLDDPLVTDCDGGQTAADGD